jgi:hypothetical protein
MVGHRHWNLGFQIQDWGIRFMLMKMDINKKFVVYELNNVMGSEKQSLRKS